MFTPTQFTEGMIIVGLLMALLTLLIGVEVGIDLLLIGSILLIGGFAGLWTQNIIVSLVVSIVLAFLYLVYGRSLIKQKLIVRTSATNIDKLIGQVATVKKAIEAGEYGIVKLDDEEWRATSAADQAIGTKVIIRSVQGVTLEVEKK